nr:MAG TPA: hypothetical protein [Caudoviricetes sp.]
MTSPDFSPILLVQALAFRVQKKGVSQNEIKSRLYA